MIIPEYKEINFNPPYWFNLLFEAKVIKLKNSLLVGDINDIGVILKEIGEMFSPDYPILQNINHIYNRGFDIQMEKKVMREILSKFDSEEVLNELSDYILANLKKL